MTTPKICLKIIFLRLTLLFSSSDCANNCMVPLRESGHEEACL